MSVFHDKKMGLPPLSTDPGYTALAEEYQLTRAVSSVGELDAVDVQRHSEVHCPPRVRCVSRVSTRPI